MGGASGARVTAIEPEPISDLIELVEEYPDLEVVERRASTRCATCRSPT